MFCIIGKILLEIYSCGIFVLQFQYTIDAKVTETISQLGTDDEAES